MDESVLAEVLGIEQLPKHIKHVDEILLELPISASPSLSAPTARLLNRKGKRLRPSLVIASSTHSDKELNSSVIAAASAIELIHVASLVHDDIIDSSDERWGIPTISEQEGVDSAILVGDYLVALAGVQAASVSSQVAREVAEVFAIMCDGQSMELSDIGNLDRSIDSYLKCIAAKTAALFAAACRIGGYCADLSTSDIDALSRYGQAFGMAFQLTDDLMDLLSTSDNLGKPVGNDVKEGVYTLPVLLGLQSQNSQKLRSALGQTPPSPQSIIKLLGHTGSITKTLAEIDRYNAQAISALQHFSNQTSAQSLQKLPNAYKQLVLKDTVLY